MQDLLSKPIRDFVFPIGSVEGDRFTLQGTAFFIGGSGVAVTAAHVTDDLARGGRAVGLLVHDGRWVVIDVEAADAHPTEDVGILKMQGAWHSIIEFTDEPHHASRGYSLWGYPDRVATELRQSAEKVEDLEIVRPDLIFNRGYVRRRMSKLPVSIYRGQAFFELSEVAGSCCSGSPLILEPLAVGAWKAFGVYIGEETGNAVAAVGYAARAEEVAHWCPAILSGQSLIGQRATVQ